MSINFSIGAAAHPFGTPSPHPLNEVAGVPAAGHRTSLDQQGASGAGLGGLPLPPLPPHVAMLTASRSDMWQAIVHAVGRHMGIPGADDLSPAEIIRGL